MNKKLLIILTLQCSCLIYCREDCFIEDCFVNNCYKKQFWSGEELTFFVYILEHEVVNIKITYEGLEETEHFTTLYFSPSRKKSKRIETTYERDIKLNLDPMKKSNDWVEFKISKENEIIVVTCEPDTIEHISINQTSHIFKDLIIRASNISFCKDEKEWEVLGEDHITIPLGKEIMNKSFRLKFEPFRPRHHIRPVIRIFNQSESLNTNDYRLTIEKNKVTLKPSKVARNDIIIIGNQTLSTIDISSQSGMFSVLVKFNVNSIPESDPKEKNCSNSLQNITNECDDNDKENSETLYIVLFACATTVIGIYGIVKGLFWLKVLPTKKQIKCWGNKETVTTNSNADETGESELAVLNPNDTSGIN